MEASEVTALLTKRLGAFRSGQILEDKTADELTEEETLHAAVSMLHIRLCALRATTPRHCPHLAGKVARAACALHFVNYNFARRHTSLRMSPAMAAGVSDKLWNVGDIAALSE